MNIRGGDRTTAAVASTFLLILQFVKKNENDALASMVVVHQEQHPGKALLLKWINAHSCDYRGFAATMSPAQFAENEIIAVKWSNKKTHTNCFG